MIVLQRTFHLPARRREVHVDYLGAALIVVAASALLIWCSLAGDVFAWRSGWTVVLVTVGVVALGLTVWVEARSPEPILPLSLFRNRTIVLTTLASLLVGVVLFGGSVFVPPYLQLAQGLSPGQTGLLSLPLALGVVVASTVAGHLITATGRWKAVLVTGAVLTGGGAVMLAMVDGNTGLGWFAAAIVVLGLGVGSLMQNLVLVAQSSVEMRQLGVATSTLSFFRSLGGSVGVTVLGAVLAHRVRSVIESRAPQGAGTGDGDVGGTLPDLDSLPEPVRAVIAEAYAVATGDIFVLTVPVAVLILLTVALLRNRPLASQFGMPPGPRRAGGQGPGGQAPGGDGPGGQGPGDPGPVPGGRSPPRPASRAGRPWADARCTVTAGPSPGRPSPYGRRHQSTCAEYSSYFCAWVRWARSASTIIVISSSNFSLGCQPSSSRARVGSAQSVSTSAGRTNSSSTTTYRDQSRPTAPKAIRTASRTECTTPVPTT